MITIMYICYLICCFVVGWFIGTGLARLIDYIITRWRMRKFLNDMDNEYEDETYPINDDNEIN